MLADILHIGTRYRFSSDGLDNILSLPDGQARTLAWSPPDEDSHARTITNVGPDLADCIQPLPASVAGELRGYVLAAVPAGLAGQAVVQVDRSAVASLMMGATLFGYFLARLTTGTEPLSGGMEGGLAACADWNSTSAFVVASNWVGKLLQLPEESPDPLLRFESLRGVATEIQTAANSQVGEFYNDGQSSSGPNSTSLPDADLLSLQAASLASLLAQAGLVGFTLGEWEVKVLRVVSPRGAPG